MTGCSAYKCDSRSCKKIPGITFHRFPRNEALQKQWVKAIGKADFQPSSSTRLCSLHFNEDQFDRSSLCGKVRLRENVVPSRFNELPEYSEEPGKVRSRRPTRSANGEKFMENFNPDTSARETRKMNRKIYSQSRKANVHDSKGIHITSGLDLCDCLDRDCPGCYLPCPKCSSAKCGHECRVNRKWTYEKSEIEGTSINLKSPVFKN